MELWIRSQNKTALMKIIDIRLYPDNVYNKTDIFIRDINGDIVSIGSYKTKERALEILDEIQNIFSLKIENKSYEESDLFLKAKMLDSVYEMPEE